VSEERWRLTYRCEPHLIEGLRRHPNQSAPNNCFFVDLTLLESALEGGLEGLQHYPETALYIAYGLVNDVNETARLHRYHRARS
jgi:hypothetical protein